MIFNCHTSANVEDQVIYPYIYSRRVATLYLSTNIYTVWVNNPVHSKTSKRCTLSVAKCYSLNWICIFRVPQVSEFISSSAVRKQFVSDLPSHWHTTKIRLTNTLFINILLDILLNLSNQLQLPCVNSESKQKQRNFDWLFRIFITRSPNVKSKCTRCIDGYLIP